MKSRCSSWLFASLLFAFAGGPRGQSPAQASSQQTAPAPAPSQPPAPSPAPPKEKPKKVWTNDDVGGISGGVSVVGNSSPEGKGKDKRGGPRRQTGQSVALLRKELQTLRSQLEQTEKQIGDLRNFKAGNNASSSGGVKITGRYTMTPVEEQIRQLEQKRKQIQARIDDVEDQARKMGIEPGDLR